MNARSLFGQEVARIHCVGVGGMGLAPLAIYLARSGWNVTGEDDAPTPEVAALLNDHGVTLSDLPADCDLLVISSAIAPRHTTVQAAAKRGLPVVRRGEMLAEVVKGKKLVAVCGSHGKTTTSTMLAAALHAAGFGAGYVLGGLPARGGFPPASVGANDWVVAEIDESDGTIAHFSPELTLTVNLDWDHVDHYRRAEDLGAAFGGLFARTQGAVLVNQGCELSRGIAAAAVPGRVHTFGPGGDFASEVSADDAAGMTLQLGGKFQIATAQVRAHGRFNALNATAALAAVQLMGASLQSDLLATFPGVRRRQTVLSTLGDVRVIEDYAHHPSEIRALLAELRRERGGTGRLVTIFQPHRFSRTAQFKIGFAEALQAADDIMLLEVYGAGEAPVAGGSTADLLKEFSAGRARHFAADADLFASLDAAIRPGDCVAFVGAGSIDRKARAWLAQRHRNFWDRFADNARLRISAASKLTREEPLANKTTMRVGGAARVYAEPVDIADLQGLLRMAREQGVPVLPLGRGSNLIIADEGVDALVISLGHARWATFEPRGADRVWVGAGLRLKNLCGLAAKAGLTGFEFLEGIPGNVGGALRMNAGAMGGWMFDVVEEVQFVTLQGEVVTRRKEDMQVTYRHCADLDHAIALGALLRPAAASDADSVNRQIDVYRRKRQESQPREPSAGCIFKNPEGNSAGRLIDQTGLKGLRVGDAEVSPVHANFIVNRGGASGADVLGLVRAVRNRVQAAHGVLLEPEAQLFGKTWEEVL
ncbi:MAG: UDP-N-acetylmuramate dehydrogenase [Opitutaceae bacterium]|nr:UDP-N-acetylmuramate dehydrogenase [Cephaloticoccus sp.]MCP5530231.1 UDP-N-acetylmuramate dehydrogenase [Opitutaceae bacterium]